MIAALAVGVSVFFLQGYLNPEPSPVEDRLNRIKAVQADAEQADPTLARLSKLYSAEYSNENLGKFLSKYNYIHDLRKLMHQAGMKMQVDRFVLMFMVAPVGFCIFLGAALGPLIMLAGPVIAFCSTLFLKFKRGARFKTLVAQLPDALNLITSSLRAGHAFQSALQVVSTEMPNPIAGEFAILVRDINLGVPIKDALDKMINNLDTLNDVRMFVTAVQIQREAGGNLAEILDKLSYTIRERFKLKGQIASLTGQATLTGYILGGAPIVLLIGLTIFMPTYLDKLYNTDMGRGMLLAGGVMQLIGFFVMRKIIDIRI